MSYLDLKEFFIRSKQKPSLAAFFDGIHQVQDLLGKPVIGLRLPQHFLGQDKVEHFRARSGLFKSAVIEQDAEPVRLKFSQGQGDTVELPGNHAGVMLLLGHKRHRAEHVEPADVIVILPFLGDLQPDPLFLHLDKSFFIRHGPSKVVPLHFFATDIPEIAVLLLCFYALHQRVDINVFRHLHDGGSDPFRPQVKGPEELHIQLDLVEGKLFENIQGGIGAAEIIHPDPETGRTEAVYNPFQLFLLISHYALGDFKVNIFMRNLVLADDPFRNGKNITKGKVQTGKVHRNRDRRFPVGDAFPDPFAHLPEDGGVKMVDHPLLFQHRDELVGVQLAEFRVDPPGQRLKAAQFPGECADDRLIENLDVLPFYRLFIILFDEILQIFSHNQNSSCRAAHPCCEQIPCPKYYLASLFNSNSYYYTITFRRPQDS